MKKYKESSDNILLKSNGKVVSELRSDYRTLQNEEQS